MSALMVKPRATNIGPDKIRAKEIGQRIALARKEMGGMTQRELGNILGVTDRSVASWEAGTYIPYKFVRKLEEALDRPAAWILYGDEGHDPAQRIEDGLEKLDRMERVLERIVYLLEGEQK